MAIQNFCRGVRSVFSVVYGFQTSYHIQHLTEKRETFQTYHIYNLKIIKNISEMAQSITIRELVTQIGGGLVNSL